MNAAYCLHGEPCTSRGRTAQGRFGPSISGTPCLFGRRVLRPHRERWPTLLVSRHAHSGPESLPSFNIRKKLQDTALPFTASAFSQRSVGSRFISRSRHAQHCPAARGAWLEGHPFVTAFASKSGARRLFPRADRTMRAVAARKAQRGCRRGLEGGAPWGGSPKQHPPSPVWKTQLQTS